MVRRWHRSGHTWFACVLALLIAAGGFPGQATARAVTLARPTSAPTAAIARPQTAIGGTHARTKFDAPVRASFPMDHLANEPAALGPGAAASSSAKPKAAVRFA